MARMFPETFTLPEKAHLEGEQVVFHALQKQLGDEFTVLWSISTHGTNHREIDFLVMAPHLGLAVVEVKGGIISLGDPDEKLCRWIGTTRTNKTFPLKNPYQQAVSAGLKFIPDWKAHSPATAYYGLTPVVILPHTPKPADAAAALGDKAAHFLFENDMALIGRRIVALMEADAATPLGEAGVASIVELYSRRHKPPPADRLEQPDTPEPVTAVPADQSPPAAAVNSDVKIIYILYMVGLIFPLTAIIGIVLAHAGSGSVESQSHYSNQKRIFWWGLPWMILVAVLSMIGAGTAIFTFGLSFIPAVICGACVAIWILYRCIRGLVAANDGHPYGTPRAIGAGIAAPAPIALRSRNKWTAMAPAALGGAALVIVGILVRPLIFPPTTSSMPLPVQPTPTKAVSKPAPPKAPPVDSGTPDLLDTATLSLNGRRVPLAGLRPVDMEEAAAAARSYLAQTNGVRCEQAPVGGWRCTSMSKGLDIAEVFALSGFAKAAANAPAAILNAEGMARENRRGVWGPR